MAIQAIAFYVLSTIMVASGFAVVTCAQSRCTACCS